MIKMCVVRRLLVTIILLETIIWTYKPLCTAYSSSRCECPTNDGDTIGQDSGNMWAKSYSPVGPAFSTVNYHGQIPIYYQLFYGQKPFPPPSNPINYQQPYRYHMQQSSVDRPNNKGESYHFIYEAANYRKEESADHNGNIRGHFEYEDDAGLHTLNYTCDDKTGFRITGGNLAPAFPEFLPPIRGEIGKAATPKPPSTRRPSTKEPAADKLDFPISEDSESAAVSFSLPHLNVNLENLTMQLNELFKTFFSAPKNGGKNRPYYISVNSGSLRMEESSYSNGDARGRIQFDDVDSHHNLSYFRNTVIGFLVTGGDLAIRSPTYLPPIYRNYTSTPGRINNGTAVRDINEEVTFIRGKTAAKPGE